MSELLADRAGGEDRLHPAAGGQAQPVAPTGCGEDLEERVGQRRYVVAPHQDPAVLVAPSDKFACPGASVSTTGRPLAIASSGATANPSCRLADTQTSHAASRARTCSESA